MAHPHEAPIDDYPIDIGSSGPSLGAEFQHWPPISPPSVGAQSVIPQMAGPMPSSMPAPMPAPMAPPLGAYPWVPQPSPLGALGAGGFMGSVGWLIVGITVGYVFGTQSKRRSVP